MNALQADSEEQRRRHSTCPAHLSSPVLQLPSSSERLGVRLEADLLLRSAALPSRSGTRYDCRFEAEAGWQRMGGTDMFREAVP